MNIIESQTIWALDKTEVRNHLLMNASIHDITSDPKILRAYAKEGIVPNLHAFLVRNANWIMNELVRYLDKTFPHVYTMRNGIEIYLLNTSAETANAVTWDMVSGPWSENPRFFVGMDVDALTEVFALYERLLWQRIRDTGRSEMTMGQIADELSLDWPRKTALRTVGSFERKRTSVVRTKGYGKKVKLPMLLSCVLWAACDGVIGKRPEGAMSPIDAIEAAELPEAEERVLHMRFLDGEPRTLEEAGQVLGLTRERVRQIQSYALDRIKRRKLTEPVREWLLAKSEAVFDHLSEDGGLTVKRAASSGTKAKTEVQGLALALEITDMRMADLLAKVAIQAGGGHWIRKV